MDYRHVEHDDDLATVRDDDRQKVYRPIPTAACRRVQHDDDDVLVTFRDDDRQNVYGPNPTTAAW